MYRVVVQDQAKPSVAALPTGAAESLAELFDRLRLDPWWGEPYRRENPTGNIRTLPFGNGGFVTYLILDRDDEVHVIEVFWAG